MSFDYLEHFGRVRRFLPYRSDYYRPNWVYQAFLRHCSIPPPVVPGESYLPAVCTLSIERRRLGVWDIQPFVPSASQQLEISRALSVLRFYFQRHFGDSVFQVLTHAETISYVLTSESKFGIAGFPFSGTKLDCLSRPEFVAEWIKWDESLTNDVLFPVALKRELLKKSKVDSKRTRLFFCGPIFFHLSCVRRLSGVLDALPRLPCVAIGRSWEYGGWNRFVRTFSGPHIWCTDFADMDLHVSPYLFDAVSSLLAPYCACSASEVDQLFSIACNSNLVTTDGYLFRKFTGNPSGWLGTIALNTLSLFLLTVIWQLRNGKGVEQILTSNFHFLGDDSVIDTDIPVSPKNVWEEFGMVVKNDSCFSLSQILDVEFAGATSVLIDDVYMRNPRCRKFFDSLMWLDSNNISNEYDRARGYLKELWPIPEYRVFVRAYANFIRDRYPAFKLPPVESDAVLRQLHAGFEGGWCTHKLPPMSQKKASGKQAKPMKRTGQLVPYKPKAVAPQPRTYQPVARAAANPMIVRGTKSTHVKNNARFSGTVFLGNVTSGATPIAGDILVSVPLNPQTIGPSQMAYFSFMFAKFRFRKLVLRYVPTVGTTTAGSAIVWYSPDADEVTPPSTTMAEVAVSHDCSFITPVWQPANAVWRCGKDSTWYFTRGNGASVGVDRFSEQGIVRVGFDFAATASTQYGRLFMDYSVEFTQPELDPSGLGSLMYNYSNETTSPQTFTNGSTYYLMNLTGTGPQESSLLPSPPRYGSLVDRVWMDPGVYSIDMSMDIPKGSAITTTTPFGTVYCEGQTYAAGTNGLGATAVEVDNLTSGQTWAVSISGVFEVLERCWVDFRTAWNAETNSSNWDQYVTIAPVAAGILKTALTLLGSHPDAVIRRVNGREQIYVLRKGGNYHLEKVNGVRTWVRNESLCETPKAPSDDVPAGPTLEWAHAQAAAVAAYHPLSTVTIDPRIDQRVVDPRSVSGYIRH